MTVILSQQFFSGEGVSVGLLTAILTRALALHSRQGREPLRGNNNNIYHLSRRPSARSHHFGFDPGLHQVREVSCDLPPLAGPRVEPRVISSSCDLPPLAGPRVGIARLSARHI